MEEAVGDETIAHGVGETSQFDPVDAHASRPKPRSSARASAIANPTPATPPSQGNGGGASSWLEMVTAVVQAPVGMGRDQAAKLQSAADGLDRFIENRIEYVLNRVNIPSRSDIERLNRSVDVLTAKVDALLARQRGGN